MIDLWDLLRQVDYTARAKELWASVDTFDPRFLAVLVLVVVYVGSKVSSGSPAARRLGLRLGLATFLIYGGYIYVVGHLEGESFGWVALRAGVVGGAVLGISWVVLPIAMFVWANFRLALGSFLAYCCYAAITTEHLTSDHLPGIGLQALGFVTLILIVAWIVQPLWDFLKDLLPRRKEDGEPAEDRTDRRTRRELSRLRKLVESQVKPTSTDEPHRREKALLAVEFSYTLAAPTLGSCLPHEVFDDFVRRYLGNHLPVDEVEANSRQIVVLLQQHLRTIQGGGLGEPPGHDGSHHRDAFATASPGVIAAGIPGPAELSLLLESHVFHGSASGAAIT